MKSKRLLLLLLLAIGLPWAAQAQEELTVYEGTNTNSYVPAYMGYFDEFSRSQFVIPAEDLDEMNGGTISSIKFYTTNSNVPYTSVSTVDVYLLEVDYTSISAFEPKTNDAIVYQGTLNIVTEGDGGSLTIEFSTPYTYNGGNLLVAIENTTDAGYKFIYFYGQNVTGASGAGSNSSSLSGVTFTQRNFIPKTTFTYTAGAPSTCPRPKNLAASDVTANSAVLTWEAGGDETEWMVEYKTDDATEWTLVAGTVNTPTYTMNGLTAATNYQARVQAACNEGKYVSTTFTTPCDAYAIPYTYDFEAEAPFACWTPITGVTRGNSTSYAHNSTYYLRFAGTTSNLVALPQFNEPTNNLRVEFWTRPEGYTYANCGTFSVGYMTDINDASTFVEVANYAYNEWTSNTHVKKTVDFNNAPANANIAFRHNAGSTSYYWFADDVTVKEIPSCVAPTGLAANATSTSAELSWTANSGETAWTLYWKKTTDETYTEVANATNPYTLNGLDASSNYQYYVVANCSADDASEASEVFPFVTECEAISTYPWTENFDSYTGATSGSTNNLPLCWNYINTCTYSSYKGYPVIYSGSGYSNSGNNHLRFYSYYSTYSSYDPQDQYAILPEMENLNGKQLSLFARGANTNSSFKVGLMTDPTDVSTFVEIATTTPTTGYVEYIYNLTGTGNYIAIMMEAANSTVTSRTVYIDDISIAEPPACPKPTDLTVVANSVTAHSAQLSWVSDATAWIVAYKTAEEEEFTEVNATENPFTLTGLNDGMAYTAKVCAVCDGTPGEWNNTTVSFTTPIACPAPTNLACNGITGSQTTLNWSGTSDSYDVLYRTAAYAEGIYEQFNTSGTPSGWTQYSGLVDEVIAGTATLSTGGNWNMNSNALGTYNIKLNIYGTGVKSWLVTPEFDLSQNLSFDLALTDYGNADPIEDATAQADDRFVVLIYADNVWTILREWNNTGSEYVYNTIATTGEHVDINLSAYVGKTVKIAFYGESTASGGDNDLHIDNVYCGIPHEAGEWQTAAEGVTGTTYTLTGLNPETDYEAKVLSNCEGETGHETVISFTTEAACMVPTELTVVSVTTTTAVLTWTSSSTAWQIQVNEEEPIDVTSIPYTLEGLTPATTYTFKVRANCDGSYTEWSNAEGFATDCDAITTFPWNEDFERFEASSSGITFNAPCWVNEHISGSGTYFFEVYSGTNGTNSTKQLRLRDMSSGTMTKLMLPEMTLPSNDYLFSIDVYRNISTANYGEGIRVFVSTNGEIEGATELAFISRSYATSDGNLIPAESVSGWYTYELPIGISGTCYIILRGESLYGSSTYMDNFAVKQMPTCLKPTAFECTAPTTTTATFSWTNGAADQTAWQICLNGDETNLIMANSNPFTVEDLTASTNYTAKVRAYCSADDQSDWSNEVSFATECEAIVVDVANPFTEGFEGDWTPLCWESIPYIDGTTTRQWTKTTTSSYIHTGAGAAYSGYYGPIYLVMPDLQLGTDGDAVQLTFWSNNSYADDYDKNSVVLLDGENEIELWSPESVVNSWEETTIDLTAYMGQTISLAFKYEGDNAHGWYVDDVEVTMMKTFTKHIIGYASDEEGSNGNNYYLIASPLAAEVAPTTVGGMITDEYGTDVTPATSTYDLYSFDEAEDLEWQNYRAASNFNLVNGQGYLYASKNGTTLTFTGAPYSGDTKEVTLSMTDNENADFQGWNLVGNPFTDLAYIDRPFYRMDATGTRVLAEEQTGAIQVMEGVFVVATEDEEHMAFSTVAPNNNGKGLVLNLSQGRGNTIDRAIVGIGQGHTLPKFMFNPNDTKLYIPQNGKDYAVVRSRVSDEIPVNFLPTEDGYYKISVDVRNMNLRSLVLKDKVRNVSIDLLRTPNYMFKASAYDRADRFVLSFKNGNGIYKEKIVKGANPEDFSFYSNGVFVIDNEGEANLQVIDMNGRVLSSENIYGSTSITVDAAPGIYLLRLTNGDNVKVQKVVVE